MAMSFASASAVPGANARTALGDEIQEIVVETLNFKALNGEKKVKLLRQPWPLNDLPSSTSSLLSISSKQGLLAAAGPNSLVLARTKAVRDAFTNEDGQDVRDFQPAMEIPVPKLSQVAFTADGAFLVICAQEGGGLGVYETQSILQDKKEPAFQLSTNQTSIRALVPNPALEFAHLVAVILTDGKLLIADLKTRQFTKNSAGSPSLKEGVAAVSWSNRGRQLTAGMADGNCFQLDQTGAVKASVPAPPELPSPCHVSSLVWLANEEWLICYTPNNSDDPDRAPESIICHVQTDKERSNFVYRKPAIEPVGNFGMNRVPLTYYVARLRNWYNIKDWLILSSVVSSETAMFTNATAPLTSESPVTGTYTVTAFANDSSRLSIPMSVLDAEDTTPIGMALDLSSTDKVLQPIPGDEMDESPFPLPALMLLNNEGVLVASWIVYNDALRNNQPCPDMTATLPAAQITSPQTPATNVFGASMATPAPPAFGAGFAKPALPAFGQSSFGSASATPTFGGTSQMGNKQSIWGGGGITAAKPAFGQSSMGVGKPTFGSTSAFGAAANSASPFATNAGKSSASPFGALGNSVANSKPPAASPFSTFASSGSTSSPFGALASNQSPFAQQGKSGQSVFATSGTTTGSTPTASFGGSTLGGKSVFGTPSQPDSVFNKPTLTPAESRESDMMDDSDKAPTPKDEKSTSGILGLPPGGFKLGTTFKPGNVDDKSDAEEEKKKPESRPHGLFGADFGAALNDAQKEREKTATPPIKKEPQGEEKKSIFGLPSIVKKESPNEEKKSIFGLPSMVKKEEDKPKPSIFGSDSTSTPNNTFSFGKPSATPASLKPDPEPPQVTSKPAPSPSTTTAPSSEGKTSFKGSKDGSDDSGPLAGSEAEAVEMPASDDDDLLEEGEAVDDIPLPPDPSTIKVKKGFYDFMPGASTSQEAPPPKAPSPPLQTQQQYSTQSPAPLFDSKSSTTPAGFPKAPQMFAPPIPAVRDMPRSPSPVRSASTPAGRPFSRPSSRPSSVRPPVTSSIPPPQQPAQPAVVTPASLQDKEAERNRVILESPIQPTLRLAKYITHQDYVGPKGEGKISSQIENLFRDINSMIDALGLNARALTEFVEGHNSLMPDNGRTKEDIENPDEDEGWCLAEIDELMAIERQLNDELDGERIEDKEELIAELFAMRRELVRVKNKLKEVKHFLVQAKDTEKLDQRRKAPLDKVMESKQREVKQDMARFLKLLVEAEEAVSMLKVKLVSSGKGAGGQVPTVEAVEKTVRKMTLWAEEKGTDLDVLEAQMKKLGLLGASSRYSPRTSMNGSTARLRRSGIFSTPSPKKTPGKKTSSFAVPEESDSEGESDANGFVEIDAKQEFVREMVEARRRKRVAMGRVRDALRRRGLKVTEA
ncbi:hypothetical protein, variant [Verruconis gallopava]|uniref:Nucleoporin Nup159/Nup146 N-terminal domain-containing protein n=1 Tax=Verruconis gallopava TaxID=253628 RepID=A0A0D2A7N3_9PEZI|nr:hypothetical protein, variant [Verruconis gallopava]KIW02773.1 hypothetical protein, variant [Verruconis gallopava]